MKRENRYGWLISLGLVGIACAMLLFCGGCMTPQQKGISCQAAQTAYAAYYAILAAGHEPSEAEVYAAAAGAAVLHAYCGWSTVPAEKSTGRAYVIDTHGVLIVVPPPVQ